MQSSNSSSPSTPPDAAVASSPLLSISISDRLNRGRRLIRHTPSLQTAARFFRSASGRRMLFRDPSVQVREAAAEQLEERQSGWASSKPVLILDVSWNMALLAIGVTVLGLSMKENPCVPLRFWIVGYLLQGLVHSLCVIVEYKRRRIASSSVLRHNRTWENGGGLNFSSRSDAEGFSTEEDDGNSITKRLESAITVVSFLWWLIGFYWVSIVGDQSSIRDSPQLYWLSVTFLAFDIVILLICIAVTCLIGIAVCCCLPCILAILYFVADQGGATKEEIDELPKFKFRRILEYDKVDGNVLESSRGIITDCDCDTPAEPHFLSLQDAECSICLTSYEDGAELRELPCSHRFHCACIDKWLHLNATCPLCKFNVLSTANHQEV